MHGARKKPPYRVQVAFPSGAPFWEYFRDVVVGARHYGFSTGRLEFVDRWLDHENRGDLRALAARDGVQGIVAVLHHREDELRYGDLGLPVVNTSNTLGLSAIPLVTQDDVAVGRLAAEHLCDCGCRSFGFWGQKGGNYAEERLKGYRAVLRDRGHEQSLQVSTSHERSWSQDEMQAWLARLERPAGVFAVLDTFGLGLIRAARGLGWRVPEDVAVLGAGNDAFWVEFESIPLSSIRLPAKKIGYEAAAMLDRLITRGETTAETVHLPVSEIAIRRSTDILHVNDPAVSRALSYIRANATANPYVSDVARAAYVSLSSLQVRFKNEIGRTLSAEIRRIRIVRAQELLADTDLPMTLVGERSGFPNSQQFSVTFHKGTGLTPRAYRQQFRRSRFSDAH